MPVLQLDDQQFPLKAGSTKIGAGAGADITVPGYSAIPVEAIIDGGSTPTIRRAEENAHVRVNGVLLGAEPTPLMHGDKLEVAGLELRYADDAKGGATQFVSASEIAAMAGAKRSGAARATAASGGRLVSLVDGKEYGVADGGLVIGRDAACDVVVPQTEVSRKHAEIKPDDKGYTLRDTSANGVFVNGQRIQAAHVLSRADVIRIGTEEFRFYADVLPAAPAAPAMPTPASMPAIPAQPVASAPPTPPAPVAPPAPPAFEIMDATASLSDLELVPDLPPPPPVKVAQPSAPPAAPPIAAGVTAPAPSAAAQKPSADKRPVLAVLEALNEGPGKGTKHELRTPLIHIGRGAHNDIQLNDESVSETHAKLQRRDDGWYAVDMDSTNGTYVGGTRVTGEKKIDGSPDVRFGGVKFRFAPQGPSEIETKGTRTIAPVSRPSTTAPVQPTAKVPAPLPSPTPAVQTPVAEKSGGIPAVVWIVIALVVIGAVAFFVLKGKA